MKHTRCMFHFCFQCFIFAFNVSFLLSMFHFTSIDDKKRNLVQEIQKYSARDFKPQCKRYKMKG